MPYALHFPSKTKYHATDFLREKREDERRYKQKKTEFYCSSCFDLLQEKKGVLPTIADIPQVSHVDHSKTKQDTFFRLWPDTMPHLDGCLFKNPYSDIRDISEEYGVQGTGTGEKRVYILDILEAKPAKIVQPRLFEESSNHSEKQSSSHISTSQIRPAYFLETIYERHGMSAWKETRVKTEDGDTLKISDLLVDVDKAEEVIDQYEGEKEGPICILRGIVQSYRENYGDYIEINLTPLEKRPTVRLVIDKDSIYHLDDIRCLKEREIACYGRLQRYNNGLIYMDLKSFDRQIIFLDKHKFDKSEKKRPVINPPIRRSRIDKAIDTIFKGFPYEKLDVNEQSFQHYQRINLEDKQKERIQKKDSLDSLKQEVMSTRDQIEALSNERTKYVNKMESINMEREQLLTTMQDVEGQIERYEKSIRNQLSKKMNWLDAPKRIRILKRDQETRRQRLLELQRQSDEPIELHTRMLELQHRDQLLNREEEELSTELKSIEQEINDHQSMVHKEKKWREIIEHSQSEVRKVPLKRSKFAFLLVGIRIEQMQTNSNLWEVHFYTQPCDTDDIQLLSKKPLKEEGCLLDGREDHPYKALSIFGKEFRKLFWNT